MLAGALRRLEITRQAMLAGLKWADAYHIKEDAMQRRVTRPASQARDVCRCITTNETLVG